MPVDRTHDISSASYHVKDVQALGKVLTEAGNAAFPNRGRSRYKEAHVLLLSWEDDDLGVIDEVNDLQDVFRQSYNYETEVWKIPGTRSHNSLATRILQLLADHEARDSLLIVYYGGHGLMNDDRQCIWSCTGNADSVEVRWYAIQTMLEEAQSDVLVLLDCCAAASSATGAGSGITEVIAACGFETWAPGVGQHSFTRSLTEELKYLYRTAPFSTALLHNVVLSRVTYWKPRYGISASDQERRKTPIYIVLSNESKQRSIEIAPIPAPVFTAGLSETSPRESASRASSTSSRSSDMANSPRPSQSSKSSIDEVWPDKSFRCPKVLISVALEEEQWLSTQQWKDWLRSIPGLVRYANVEGVYGSDSTLLLLSVPVAIWDLLPANPAMAFVSFSRTRELTNLDSSPRSEMQETASMDEPDKPFHRTEGPKDAGSLSEIDVMYIQEFAERLAPLMDALSGTEIFSSLIPFMSRREPMVCEVVKACGALYLAQEDHENSFSAGAAQHYHARTSALFRPLSTKTCSKQYTEMCAVIATINIVYEMMSGTELMEHITIARALIQECHWNALSSGLARACFWFNVGMDALNSVMCNSSVAWDPDQWGYDPGESEISSLREIPTPEAWVHKLLYILAKTVTHCATKPRARSPGATGGGQLAQRAQAWDYLTQLGDWCRDVTPRRMQPLASLDPGFQSRTYYFPNPGLLSREANIGQLLYHLTSCLLAQTDPRGRQDDLGLSSARAICCILTNNQDPAVATIGWPALRAAAEVLTDKMEKNEVTVLLSDIQERSAWRVDNDLTRLGQTERQRKPTTRMPRARDTHYVQALYDYSSGDARVLDFREGDIIQVLTHLRSGWCDGVIGRRRGWFPGLYCENLGDASPERSDVSTAREVAEGADISTPFGAPKDKSHKRLRGCLDTDDAATENWEWFNAQTAKPFGNSPLATGAPQGGSSSWFNLIAPVDDPRRDMDLDSGLGMSLAGSRLGMSLLGSQRSPSAKKHQCPYCSTGFTRHHNLKSHLLTHSQEKPYRCASCDAGFRRLHDLKRHAKLHTGDGQRTYVCPRCGRVFPRGNALLQHTKEQDGCASRRSSIGGLEGDGTDGERDIQGQDDGMHGLIYTNQALPDLDENEQDLKDSGS